MNKEDQEFKLAQRIVTYEHLQVAYSCSKADLVITLYYL